MFDIGRVSTNTPLVGGGQFPVTLLSHGTGGSPESLGWLACRLAQQGRIVLAPHHHGNTGSEPYVAEGFLCWWERATDMSRLLDALDATGPFAGGRLDLGQVSGLGFSLGAYTVLKLAGAQTDMARFFTWVEETGYDLSGPPEFPDVTQDIDRLYETSIAFRASWDRHGQDAQDPRFRKVAALAAPPPVRAFNPDSLQAITVPVALVTGEADAEAPSALCADWLAQVNPAFQRHSIGAQVGHYSFLGHPTGPVPPQVAFLFADPAGMNRAQVHDAVFDLLAAFLP